MANRNFNRKQALEKEVKEIYAKVTIGASGAVSATDALGVASVVETSTGVYTLTLQDKYMDLMQASVSIESAAAQDLTAQVQSQDVANAKTVVIRTSDSTAAVAEPSSGSIIRVKLDLKNSSV
jgi:hypothetical protein